MTPVTLRIGYIEDMKAVFLGTGTSHGIPVIGCGCRVCNSPDPRNRRSRLGVWLGEPSSLCIFRETCGEALALEHNGDLFSCDHFVEPRHRLGNVAERPLAELVGSPQQRKFGLDKRDTLPRYCRECEVRFICNGGCPKDRILTTPDGEPGLNYLCEGFKAFFNHIDRPMKTMANLILRRRPPSEIMPMLVAAPIWPKV